VGWAAGLFLAVLSVTTLAAKEPPTPGTVRVAKGRQGMFSLTARHARLSAIATALAEASGKPLSVHADLRYKRLDAFVTETSQSALLKSVARAAHGRWAPLGKGLQLIPEPGRDRLVQKRRKGDSLNDSPEAERRQKLRVLQQLARMGRDSRALADSPLPPLARPIVGALGSLPPYQQLLAVGSSGLTLPGSDFSSPLRAQLVSALRKPGSSQPIQLDSVGLIVKGDELMAGVNTSTPGQPGNDYRAVIIRGGRRNAFGGPGAVAPARHGAANSRGSNPAAKNELMVQPQRYLVRQLTPGPYEYVESLRRMALLYHLNIMADIRFRLPPAIPSRRPGERQIWLKLLQPQLPLSEAMEAMATVFGVDYEYHDGVHYFRNRRWYWEEAFSHTDADLKRVQDIPANDRGKLENLITLLDFDRRKAEGLAVIFPRLKALALTREQVQLYAALEAGQRRQLRQADGIPLPRLKPHQQRLFWTAFGVVGVPIPPWEARRFSLQLHTSEGNDELGYQRAAQPL